MKNIFIYTSFILSSFFTTASMSVANNTVLLEKHSNTDTYISPPTNNDYNLVLTGVVLCMTNGLGLEGALVELTDLLNKTTQSYLTGLDGTYYFILESDREYQLAYKATDAFDNVEKRISTVGRSDEVLKTIFQVDECGIAKFRQNPSDVFGDENKDKNSSNSTSSLSYKIQIGAFKQPRSEQTDFRRKSGYKIVEERMPNNFYRYLTEDFYNLENTQNKLNTLKNKGYDKAFIVPYHNGVRLNISPEQAIEKYGK